MGILGTVVTVVVAGVSLWWMIRFKVGLRLHRHTDDVHSSENTMRRSNHERVPNKI
jgi:hypothetical protein